MSDNWATPPDLIKALTKEFPFNLEVCASVDNQALTDVPYMGLDNGHDALKEPWSTGEDNDPSVLWYCNPPYSQLPEFVRMAAGQGTSGMLLIPAYTDTAYWWTYITMLASEIRFLKGRLRFWENGKPGKDTARFPSALVLFDTQIKSTFRCNHRPIIRWWDWRETV